MQANIGDLVAYEDQANPRTVYRVVGLPGSDATNYILRGNPTDYRLHEVETEEVTWSDLRQAGWTPVEPICRIRFGWCQTHDEADTVRHHFATHPAATMD
jgi:hypothetical protein